MSRTETWVQVYPKPIEPGPDGEPRPLKDIQVWGPWPEWGARITEGRNREQIWKRADR